MVMPRITFRSFYESLDSLGFRFVLFIDIGPTMGSATPFSQILTIPVLRPFVHDWLYGACSAVWVIQPNSSAFVLSLVFSKRPCAVYLAGMCQIGLRVYCLSTLVFRLCILLVAPRNVLPRLRAINHSVLVASTRRCSRYGVSALNFFCCSFCCVSYCWG